MLYEVITLLLALGPSAWGGDGGPSPDREPPATAGHGGDRRDAFSRPVPGLAGEARLDLSVGRSLFQRLWVSAPASTEAADGLGPLHNARSCAGCHANNGRGHPPSGPKDRSPGLA